MAHMNATDTRFDILAVKNVYRIGNVFSIASEAMQSQYSASVSMQKFSYMAHDELSGVDIFEFFKENFFDLEKSKGIGLDSIASRVGVPRVATFDDGTQYRLNDEELKALVGFNLLANIGDSTLPSIIESMSVLFGDNVRIIDNQNMTLTLVVTGSLSRLQMWLLKYYGVSQIGAGVGYRIQYDSDEIFGFKGQKLNTFNHGVFNYSLNDTVSLNNQKE